MIPTGTLDEYPSASPERTAEILEGFKRDLGSTGITSAAREEDTKGYPANVDEQGSYIVAVEKADVPSRELKPGDIGYSANERFKTSPQLITRETEQ